MTYDSIYQVAKHIEKHHDTFAEEPASDAFTTLNLMCDYMSDNPAVVGFTFEAKTKAEYGSLDTWITINQIETGWEMIEQIRQEE